MLNHLYKYGKKDILLFLFFIFSSLCLLSIVTAKYSEGQYTGELPGLTSNTSGFWLTGTTTTIPFMFDYGLFGQIGTQSLCCSGGFFPALSSYGFPLAYSTFSPQPYQFSPSFNTQYSTVIGGESNQTMNPFSGYSWGYQTQTTPFPIYIPYTGGVQSYDFTKLTAVSQDFGQASTTTFDGGYSTDQNLCGCQLPSPSSDGTSGLPQIIDDSELVEMPPVSADYGEEAQYVEGQIIVKFKDEVTKDSQRSIHNRYGSKEVYESEYAGFVLIELPSDKTVEEMVSIYLQEDDVLVAEPNYIRRSHFTPYDS